MRSSVEPGIDNQPIIRLRKDRRPFKVVGHLHRHRGDWPIIEVDVIDSRVPTVVGLLEEMTREVYWNSAAPFIRLLRASRCSNAL